MKGCLGKFLVVTCLSLLCLIPLSLVSDVVNERGSQHYYVGEEIAAQHGGYQQLASPLLVARCVIEETRKKLINTNDLSGLVEKEYTAERTVYVPLTPKATRITGTLQPQRLHRGMYSLPVYTAKMQITGSFDRSKLPRVGEELDGGTCRSISGLRLFVPVKNPRGISSPPSLQWNGQKMDVTPGAGFDGLKSDTTGFSARVTLDDSSQLAEIPFSVGLQFQGSHTLSFSPRGGAYAVDIQSAWPHPKFQGDYLPATREITEQGFTAKWSVTKFSQTQGSTDTGMVDWNQPSFSVELIDPVDIYLQSTRAVKYGILFILLTFESFLLFELLRGLRIHPIQYVLVGGALTIFYLLLISLSEHIGFPAAYLTASAACVTVLTAYVRSIMRDTGATLVFGTCMSILYGALYIILLSEQYALALGTGLLFLTLVAAMYLTRNVDWYALEGEVDYKKLLRRKKE